MNDVDFAWSEVLCLCCNAWVISTLAICIVCLVSFVGGYLYARTDMSESTYLKDDETELERSEEDP